MTEDGYGVSYLVYEDFGESWYSYSMTCTESLPVGNYLHLFRTEAIVMNLASCIY